MWPFGPKNLKNRDLRGQDFRGKNLRGAVLTTANLRRADLKDAVVDALRDCQPLPAMAPGEVAVVNYAVDEDEVISTLPADVREWAGHWYANPEEEYFGRTGYCNTETEVDTFLKALA